MTVVNPSRPRGKKNWFSDPDTGIDKTLDDLTAAVNALEGGSVSAETYFSSSTQSIGSNTTFSSIANVMSLTPTNADLDFTLPAANVAGTVFDGGVYHFINDSGLYTYSLLNSSSGDVLARVGPKQTVTLACEDDTTADGTWRVATLDKEMVAHSIMLDLL